MNDAQLLDGLGDALVVVSEEGAVLGWYGAAARLFGWQAAEIVGRPASLVLPERPEGEGPQRQTLPRRDGSELAAVVTPSPLPGGGTAVLVKELTPWIGPATRPPTAVTAAVTEALGDIYRRIMDVSSVDSDLADNVESAALLLAEEGRRLMPDCECLVLLVQPARQDRLWVAGGAGPWAAGQVGTEFEVKGSTVGAALARRAPLELADPPADPVRGAAYKEGGIRFARVVPLYLRKPLPDGRTSVGVLGFYRTSPRPFSRLERRLIGDFGQLVAITLLRAELRFAAARSAERLQVAVDVAVDLAKSLDVKEVVNRIIRRAMGAVGAERGVLLRLEAGQTVVEDAHDLTGRPDLAGFRQPVAEQPLMARAIRARQPVRGGRYDVSAMPEPLASALRDVRHTATVPLQLGGEVVAALVLSKRTDPGFGTDDVQTLQLLGSVAALALRNAWLYEQAEEAGRVKTDFLSMAAHELRTPLTVVTGYLSLLREGSLGDAPEGWTLPLQVLGEKVDELSRLVEDLLTAARLETGRLPHSPRSVDLRQVAKAVVDRRRERLGLEVELQIPETPVIVRADADQLGRALEAVVANALIYGRDGQAPWARVTVEGRGRRATVTVADRGRGIPEAERELIFERFHRVDDRRHSSRSGTGLGLYIARALSERWGGHVELRRTGLDEGSVFELTLPRAR